MRGLAVNSKQMRLIFTGDDLFKYDIDLQSDVKSLSFWRNRCYNAIRLHNANSKEGEGVDGAADLELAIGEDD